MIFFDFLANFDGRK